MSSTENTKILIVEDDQPTQMLVANRLESWGYSVIKAANGDEAIHLAKSERPALILLDTILPQMDGREVCRLIKSDDEIKHIPVIFLTALELADHIKAGMDLGADDYVIKPINPEDLQRRIRVCLARRQDEAV